MGDRNLLSPLELVGDRLFPVLLVLADADFKVCSFSGKGCSRAELACWCCCRSAFVLGALETRLRNLANPFPELLPLLLLLFELEVLGTWGEEGSLKIGGGASVLPEISLRRPKKPLGECRRVGDKAPLIADAPSLLMPLRRESEEGPDTPSPLYLSGLLDDAAVPFEEDLEREKEDELWADADVLLLFPLEIW